MQVFYAMELSVDFCLPVKFYSRMKSSKTVLVMKIWYGKEETQGTKNFYFKRWSGKGKGINNAYIVEYRVCNVALENTRGLIPHMLCVGSEILVKKLIRVG